MEKCLLVKGMIFILFHKINLQQKFGLTEINRYVILLLSGEKKPH